MITAYGAAVDEARIDPRMRPVMVFVSGAKGDKVTTLRGFLDAGTVTS